MSAAALAGTLLLALSTAMTNAQTPPDADAPREPDVRVVYRFLEGDELIAVRGVAGNRTGRSPRETLKRRTRAGLEPVSAPPPVARRFAPFSEGFSHLEDEGEHGFVDLKGRRLETEPLDAAGDFHEGLVRVQPKGSKEWGYLDMKGALVIPARFTVVSDFSQGLAVVAVSGRDGPRFGAVNREGEEVLPFEYRQIGDFRPAPEGPSALAQRADGRREVVVLLPDGTFTPIPGAKDLAFYGSAHDRDILVAGVKDKDGLWGFMRLGTRAPAFVEPPRYERIMAPGIEREEGEYPVGAARTLARDTRDLGWVIDLSTGRRLVQKACRDALLPYGGEPVGIACLNEDGVWEEIGFISGTVRPLSPETLNSMTRKAGGRDGFKPWTRPGALGRWFR